MAEFHPKPSRTAAGVAWLRAAHQIVDDPPRILDDPIALRLLGPAGRRAIDERRTELFQPEVLGLRAHVLLRSRYVEDRLELATRRGSISSSFSVRAWTRLVTGSPRGPRGSRSSRSTSRPVRR